MVRCGCKTRFGPGALWEGVASPVRQTAIQAVRAPVCPLNFVPHKLLRHHPPGLPSACLKSCEVLARLILSTVRCISTASSEVRAAGTLSHSAARCASSILSALQHQVQDRDRVTYCFRTLHATTLQPPPLIRYSNGSRETLLDRRTPATLVRRCCRNSAPQYRHCVLTERDSAWRRTRRGQSLSL